VNCARLKPATFTPPLRPLRPLLASFGLHCAMCYIWRMSDVLDYLREQFARVNTRLDRIAEDVGEVKQRLTTLEIQVGGLVATEQSHYAQTMSRLDRFEARLDRIERRLDLTDQSAA
jgi:hypothetical protein